jgi:hypothetical protein
MKTHSGARRDDADGKRTWKRKRGIRSIAKAATWQVLLFVRVRQRVPRRTTIFISYSRKDRRWLDRLQVYLKPYDQRGLLAIWDDKKIKPGDQWRNQIQTAIDNAAASVLLVSAEFLASDFIVNDELPPLLRKAESGGAKIFPLYVGPVSLKAYPELARFQAFNDPAKPLRSLTKPRADKVLSDVAAEIDELLNSPSPAPIRVEPPPVSATLFCRFESAAIGLSILAALAASDKARDYNLTELTRALKISSRKLAHAAVEELSDAGWLEKRRLPGRTAYQITDEGVKRLNLLSSVARPAGRLV